MGIRRHLGSQSLRSIQFPLDLGKDQDGPLISREVVDLLRLGLLREPVGMISHGDA